MALGKKGKAARGRSPLHLLSQNYMKRWRQRLGDMGFPELRVGERLFVNGEHVSADSRLLPDQFGPPSADAPPDLL